MKRIFLAIAASASLAGAAFADQVTVQIPADVKTQAGARTYTDALNKAVVKVCRKEVGPVVGLAWYSFQTCLKDTKADVAKKDPTGIYASRFGRDLPVTLAAK